MQGSKKRKNPRKCRRCHQTVTAPEEIRPGGIICLECQRKRNAKRARAHYQAHRDEVIARSLAWKRAHPEKVREHRDAYMERVRADPDWLARYYEGRRLSWQAWIARKKQDPEWVELHKAQQREQHRVKRIELGLPVKPISELEYRRKYGTGYGKATRVSAKPLYPFVKLALTQFTEDELGKMAGVSHKRLHEIAEDEEKQISLVTADRLCAAFELPMSWLYQEAA